MGLSMGMVVERREPGGEWRACDWSRAVGRCSALFAQLADIGNGWYRGERGPEVFKPLGEARGVPDDASEATKEAMTYCDHTHSWFLLSELEAYDVSRTVQQSGIVDREVFESWDGRGAPGSYCGSVVGPGVVVGTLDQLMAGWKLSHVKVTWTASYEQTAQEFWREFVPWLGWLAKAAKVEPTDVRIVFGFDS